MHTNIAPYFFLFFPFQKSEKKITVIHFIYFIDKKKVWGETRAVEQFGISVQPYFTFSTS